MRGIHELQMVIEYDGTRYKGWQTLGDTAMTIQGKLQDVLSKMAGEQVELIGSGRTDAGVHARGQVANFHLSEKRVRQKSLTMSTVIFRRTLQCLPWRRCRSGFTAAIRQ